MAHPKVDSGRSVTVEARRKTVEGFAHQFFDEQLTRSPFCIPERNGERWKQLSHSLNAIRKGLDQSLKKIQALEVDSATPAVESTSDTPKSPEDCDALPIADPEAIYHYLSAEAPCEDDRGVIQDLTSRARIQRERVRKLRGQFGFESLSQNIPQELQGVLSLQRECSRKFESLQERARVLSEHPPFPRGKSLEDELERVARSPAPRSDLITSLLANSTRSLTLAYKTDVSSTLDAIVQLWKLLGGDICWSAHTLFPPLFPHDGVCSKSIRVVRKLAAHIQNHALLRDGTTGWGGSPGYFCLAGVIVVGISVLFIVLRTRSRSLHEAAPPIQPPAIGPLNAPLSLEEAFWIAVQAG